MRRVSRPEYRTTSAERHAGLDVDVLSDTTKSDGSANWNNYILVAINAEVARRAMAWRFTHPRKWARMFVTQYFLWTRADYVDPYTNGIMGSGHWFYRWHADTVRRTIFADFRPLLASVFPSFQNHLHSCCTGQPVPITLFGLVILPSVLLTSLVYAIRCMKTRAVGPVILLTLLCVAWVLLTPCLTDGEEGNRMAFSVRSLLIALSLFSWRQVSLAVRRRDSPALPGGVPA